MENSYSSYIKEVEKELDLPRYQKKELLRGFQAELEERFYGDKEAAMDLNQLGPPKEIANMLLEGIDLEERRQYHASRLLRFRVVVVALALLIVTSIGTIIYLNASEFKRVNANIVQDSIPTQHSTSVVAEDK